MLKFYFNPNIHLLSQYVIAPIVYFAFGLSHMCFTCRSDFAARSGDTHAPDRQTLTIYDLGNKLIAYSCTLTEVVDVLAEWGSLYVLTRDGLLHAFHEKDTQTKLEVTIFSIYFSGRHIGLVNFVFTCLQN